MMMVEAKIPDSLPYLRQADLSKYLLPKESSSSSSSSSKNKKTDGGGGGGQWMSISEDVEVMSNVANLPPLPQHPRKLEDYDDDESGTNTGAWEQYDPYSVQPFVEGMSEYDEYQQAWRLLGFMIDCTSNDDDESGSGSEDTTEDGCARYVLWAAYVDLDYEGGGIGEYQYWDSNSQAWNDTACYYAEGGSGDNNNGNDDDGNDYKSRCAKMDCHLEDTSFSVLGFFKHRNYDDWMEQLFKHEGMCVWTDEEYSFMKNARKAWPSGCTDTGSTNEDGDELYYNIKPLRNGRIAVGLYTDTQCLEDYSVSTDELEDVVGNFFTDNGGSGSGDNGNYDYSYDSLSDSMDRWHSAFDVWHTCHPCVAYDIENIDGSKYAGNGDDDGRRRRQLGGEYSAQGDVFECYDDAGYTNVNQCMKFSAKTTMNTATFRDLSLARTQQTLAENPLSGFFAETDYKMHGMGNVATYFYFSAAMAVFLYSALNLFYVSLRSVRAERQQRLSKGDKQNSLLPSDKHGKRAERSKGDNQNSSLPSGKKGGSKKKGKKKKMFSRFSSKKSSSDQDVELPEFS